LKTNFVLVDFENVQPKNVSLLHGHSFKIKVFVGANQSKISFDMARALQAYGPDAEYIQIDGNGKNALDFHISYYIGRLAAETPDASFYLISKDKGFDPLIKHLKAQGISCQRSSSIADIQGVKISSSKTISDRVDTVKPFDSRSTPEKADAVINHLARFKAAKPKTLKTLRGTINALFKSKLPNAELDELIVQLTSRKALKVTDGKVTYEHPFESKLSDSEPISGNVDAIIADLVRRKAARPKKLKALRSTINQLFKNQLPDTELDELVEKLTKRGVIKVIDGKVNYELL
jgi:hypothetical protein